VVSLQVTDCRETTMEVRLLASARSASSAFDLRCDIREKMIAFIQQTHPEALPRLRADVRDRRLAGDGNVASRQRTRERV
jgi:hypothetical protein